MVHVVDNVSLIDWAASLTTSDCDDDLDTTKILVSRVQLPKGIRT